jgi:hypothetical protein
MNRQIGENVFRRRMLSAVFVLSLFAVPAIVFGVSLTYTPTAGQVISASGIQSNFAALNSGKLEVANIARVSVEAVTANRPAGMGGIGVFGASCPAGKVLVGGGCFTNAYFLTVLSDGPSPYEGNGWYCAFANPVGYDVSISPGGVNLIATAICAGP